MRSIKYLTAICMFYISTQQANAQSLEWIKQIGDTYGDDGWSVVSDNFGNLLITGQFIGVVDFDPGPGVSTITSTGPVSEVFICKLTTAGDFVWAKKMGGINYDVGKDIATDNLGNVYTTGNFSGTADFDPGPGVFNLTAVSSTDAFISKLDSSGNFVWAIRLGGPDLEFGNSITVDQAGNVYSTGEFRSTVDFDPGPAVFNLTSAGERDIYILKLDSSGSFVYAKQFGSTTYDVGNSITTDSFGNVYATGYFEGTVDFDPGPGVYNLTAPNIYADCFVLKLDSVGDLLFARGLGGSSGDIGNSIQVDVWGNIYTTGYFYDTADFDPGPGTFNLVSNGVQDIFISKLDSSGNFKWAAGIGGADNDMANSISCDPYGNTYTIGYFLGVVDFDPGLDTSYLSNTLAGNSLFILKLDSLGSFSWAKWADGTNINIGRSVTCDLAGNVYSIGFFGDTMYFDPAGANILMTSNGLSDIYIARFGQFNVGIDELDHKNKIKLYPNPVHSNLYIEINPDKSSHVMIELFNIYGQKIEEIYNGTITNKGWANEINVANLNSGIYFIRASGDMDVVNRFIKY